jgi:hypothetical protein
MGEMGRAAADALTGPGRMKNYPQLRGVRLDVATERGEGPGKESFLCGRNYLAIQ